jgi:predicted  nucleic acid-binding Zn-ribbon protein
MRKICIRCGKKFNTTKLKARICLVCQKEYKRMYRRKYEQGRFKSPYKEVGINARHLHS